MLKGYHLLMDKHACKMNTRHIARPDCYVKLGAVQITHPIQKQELPSLRVLVKQEPTNEYRSTSVFEDKLLFEEVY